MNTGPESIAIATRTVACLLLGAIVAGAFAWFVWPDEAGSFDAHFLARRPMPDQEAALVEGAPCTFDTTGANQLIVMRPDGALLGAMQPTTGTLVRATLPTLAQGWICQTRVGLRIPDEPTHFYLVQVNREPAELMYDFELGEQSVWWFDEPAYPTGQEGR